MITFQLKAELEKLAVERMRQQTEQAKLEMEQSRLALIKEGKLSVVGELSRNSPLSEQSVDGFDVLGNLRLMPKFCERDPEVFFFFFVCLCLFASLMRLKLHILPSGRAHGQLRTPGTGS